MMSTKLIEDAVSMNNKQPPDKGGSEHPLSSISEPSDNDVLYGRGGRNNVHTGNKQFLDEVEKYYAAYNIAADSSQKYDITLDIVKRWRAQDPPGRFLMLDEETKLWYDVGDQKARSKTSQAMRDVATKKKREMQGSNGAIVPTRETNVMSSDFHDEISTPSEAPCTKNGSAITKIPSSSKRSFPEMNLPLKGTHIKKIIGGEGSAKLNSRDEVKSMKIKQESSESASKRAKHEHQFTHSPYSSNGHIITNAKQSATVDQWLMTHLPDLNRNNVLKYSAKLIGRGFDSIGVLDLVKEEDLDFMKMAHRRLLLRSLPNGDRETYNIKASQESSESSMKIKHEELNDNHSLQPNTPVKATHLAIKDISEPDENDCMFGRGNRSNTHIGNRHWHEEIGNCKAEYSAASDDSEKLQITKGIVKRWRARGGRFLKQDLNTKLWYDVGDQRARLKTSQAMRDAKAPPMITYIDDSGFGPAVKLISVDGVEFILPYTAAKISQTAKDAQGIDGDDSKDPEKPLDVDILNVKSKCLEKVVEYLNHYLKEPMDEIKTPLEENTFEGCVKQQWYQDFVVGVDQAMLFDLVKAANYMVIKPLMDLTCCRLACQIKGYSTDEIYCILGPLGHCQPKHEICSFLNIQPIEGKVRNIDNREEPQLPVQTLPQCPPDALPTIAAEHPFDNIQEPGNNDCLFGRGGGTNHHAGNLRWREDVIHCRPGYLAAERAAKSGITSGIVRRWREQVPPGRFLKQDEETKLWHDVGDREAYRKTSQALREASSKKPKNEERRFDGEFAQGRMQFPMMEGEQSHTTCQVPISIVSENFNGRPSQQHENGLASLPQPTAFVSLQKPNANCELTPPQYLPPSEKDFNWADAIDREGFGVVWENQVKRVKWNDPNTKNLSLMMRHLSNDGWWRLGVYAAANTHLEIISFRACSLTDEDMSDFFGNAKRNSTIKTLCLQDNLVSVEGIQSLVPFLKRSPGLSDLRINEKGMKSGVFEHIIGALDGNVHIKQIDFRDCSIYNISALERNKIPNLEILDLGGNDISPDGCMTIANLLWNKSNLKRLDLSRNRDVIKNAELLAKALSNNDKLTVLRLKGAKISENAFMAFLNLVYDKTSVDSITQSNHTLTEIDLDYDPEHYSIIQKMHAALEINKNNEGNSTAATLAKVTIMHEEKMAAFAQISESNNSKPHFTQVDKARQSLAASNLPEEPSHKVKPINGSVLNLTSNEDFDKKPAALVHPSFASLVQPSTTPQNPSTAIRSSGSDSEHESDGRSMEVDKESKAMNNAERRGSRKIPFRDQYIQLGSEKEKLRWIVSTMIKVEKSGGVRVYDNSNRLFLLRISKVKKCYEDHFHSDIPAFLSSQRNNKVNYSKFKCQCEESDRGAADVLLQLGKP